MPLDVARIRGICFDIDGTLSDTDDDWIGKFLHFFSPLRPLLPGVDLTEFARYLVTGVVNPGNAVLETMDELGADDFWRRFKRRFAGKRVKKPAHFLMVKSVPDILAALYKRYPLAIVTARTEAPAQQFLQQYNLDYYFTVVVSSESTYRAKPAADPLRFAAEKMEVAPENLLMVGDTVVDIRAGKAAGAQTVGVLWGFGTELELRLAGADAIVKTPTELLDLLRIN
ncbi:MAG TPA: HAD family hydrolase [Bellilinea sp.]|nr:HAD family hydrolase [Bellilinea sp.]